MNRDLRLRNRAVIVFLLPIVVPLWMVGWLLYRAGSQARRQWREAATVKDDGVEVAVATLEEPVETCD